MVVLDLYIGHILGRIEDAGGCACINHIGPIKGCPTFPQGNMQLATYYLSNDMQHAACDILPVNLSPHYLTSVHNISYPMCELLPTVDTLQMNNAICRLALCPMIGV
jgi:hypothetical protein